MSSNPLKREPAGNDRFHHNFVGDRIPVALGAPSLLRAPLALVACPRLSRLLHAGRSGGRPRWQAFEPCHFIAQRLLLCLQARDRRLLRLHLILQNGAIRLQLLDLRDQYANQTAQLGN